MGLVSCLASCYAREGIATKLDLLAHATLELNILKSGFLLSVILLFKCAYAILLVVIKKLFDIDFQRLGDTIKDISGGISFRISPDFPNDSLWHFGFLRKSRDVPPSSLG